MYKNNSDIADEQKICFIICSNNEYYLEECLFYINQLEIPFGYTVDVISILDAKSMTSGYNEGMRASNARYKVYLHQDVFIIYKGFLQAIIDIFQSDSSIGMIGMAGAPRMSVGGVMWYSHREGELYHINDIKENYSLYSYKLEDGLYEVEAIDGLMMITCMDIFWREDKFDGWDFYDVSQSFEFRKSGFKVVVPEQLSPWCMHNDGVLNLLNYNKYRKICMWEYPEYFYPKRFLVGKSKKNIKLEEEVKHGKIYAVIIARNQFELIMRTIETIKVFSGLDERQIIIVDNGSEDGLRHWLKRQQDYNYIICGEIIESYAVILNEVIKQFITDEDMLVLTPELMILPGCIETLSQALGIDERTGVVCAKIILSGSKEGANFMEAVKYAYVHGDRKEKNEILGCPFEGILICNKMIRQLGGFDERLLLPESTMTDFAFQGIKMHYCYYEMQNAYFYKITNDPDIYLHRFGGNIDRQVLKEKWEMNYFNEYPNYNLLSCIEKSKEDEFHVLEIGCDCGVNLLQVKNEYPKAKVYGVEMNPGAASIASHVAQIQVANVEDKSLDFQGIRFDYIIFGDVLEHLRDPEGIIQYCKNLLKENGRIIACIPNIMHYSVMRQLVEGNFTYTDMGLLDRTHIHFFTYKEILRMFARAGYQIDKLAYIKETGEVTEKDKEFVNRLVELSSKAEEFMFYVFQYIVSAQIKK